MFLYLFHFIFDCILANIVYILPDGSFLHFFAAVVCHHNQSLKHLFMFLFPSMLPVLRSFCTIETKCHPRLFVDVKKCIVHFPVLCDCMISDSPGFLVCDENVLFWFLAVLKY